MTATTSHPVAVPPDCPRCGCNFSHPHGTPQSAWGRLLQRWRCDHCGNVFTGTAPQKTQDGRSRADAVAYPVLRCPACGGRKVRTTSTRGDTRYHKCACGHTFKSREV